MRDPCIAVLVRRLVAEPEGSAEQSRDPMDATTATPALARASRMVAF